uniref:Uncharacterized protein n=1 Tax=Labrus bergylta TaxID=56723 RepID=A0A3Q3G409_9LABR
MTSHPVTELTAHLSAKKSSLYILYNLAINPDAMQTLQEEIDTNLPKDAPISYEDLTNLEYLDHVINESMRLLPTSLYDVFFLPHTCVKNESLYSLSGDFMIFRASLFVCVRRFSKDSSEEVNPYAFMPFGLGPSNCVGMRYAILTLKLVLVRLLQSYSLETCKDTMVRVYSHVLSDCHLKLSLIKLTFLPLDSLINMCLPLVADLFASKITLSTVLRLTLA